jgi:hypothetical protein
VPKLEISRVHDAYARGGECPLCWLRDAAETTYLHSFQHSRVMEPNVRVQTNRKGFCPDHYRKLYAGENKLGLALMVHTHMLEKLPDLKAGLESLCSAAGPGRPAMHAGKDCAPRGRPAMHAGKDCAPRGRPAMHAGKDCAPRGRRGRERVDAAVASLASLRDECFICELLDADVDRWVFTILYLWGKDPEFPPVLRASRGFCLGHFLDVFRTAQRMLRADRLERFCADVIPLMTGGLDRLERELWGFTQLYHDSNRSLGTDEQRTSLARALQKLAGGQFRLE